MKRLNNQAFHILQTEVRRCLGSNEIGQVQFELALRRLKRLHARSGSPATEAELRYTLDHFIPKINPKILRKAAKANRPPSRFWLGFKWGMITIVIAAIALLILINR